MKLELAQQLVEAMEYVGYEAELREAYSGRGMYGNTTAGIVCGGAGEVLHAVIVSASLFVDQEDGFSLFEDEDMFRTDSMGRDMIVY